MTLPAEVAEDFDARAMAIILTYLRQDLAGLVALTGDDADENLPQVVRILTEALLRLVGQDELERELDAWLEARRQQLGGHRRSRPRCESRPRGQLQLHCCSWCSPPPRSVGHVPRIPTVSLATFGATWSPRTREAIAAFSQFWASTFRSKWRVRSLQALSTYRARRRVTFPARDDGTSIVLPCSLRTLMPAVLDGSALTTWPLPAVRLAHAHAPRRYTHLRQHEPQVNPATNRAANAQSRSCSIQLARVNS